MCENDDDYKLIHTDGEPKKCLWIGFGEGTTRIKKWCDKVNNGRKVDEACPKTCNVCFMNDPNYTFLTNGKARRCKWIDSTNKKDKYCNKMEDGIRISRYCRGSCQEVSHAS